MKAFGASLAASVLLLLAPSVYAGPRSPAKPPPPGGGLVVHEWGTFTVLQDEQGRPVGGINTDDEPLPPFVHNLNGALNGPSSPLPPAYFKGVPRSHPDVYTRLETPVIYFYPPGGKEMKVDVEVRFPAGWLTQYYPDADVVADGRTREQFKFGPLTYKSAGTLTWRGLEVGGTQEGPATDMQAWLAPRRVPGAASVTTPKGETERYVFYRGVGRIDAPLRVSRSDDGGELHVRNEIGNAVQLEPGTTIGPLWLVDARADGRSAFRTIESVDVTAGGDTVLATTPATFSERDYSRDNLTRIRAAMHAALVGDGLFADEADGLLNTWEASYFKRPGLRMFFMVPKAWTDHHLPLRVSSPAHVERAMVGRIELVTPRQRELLRKISEGPASEPHWVEAARKQLGPAEQDQYYREDWYHHADANPTAAKLLKTMPDDYRAYLELGRFRNALLLDQAKRRPTDALTTFIDRYELDSHRFERTERAAGR